MRGNGSMKTVRILFIGDIVGIPGQAMFQKHIASIRSTYAIDGLVVNGENSSSRGRGITPQIATLFKQCGVDVITSGNHIWDAREIYGYIAENKHLVRPANYPSVTPGAGFSLFTCKGVTIAVINIQGRVFMKDHLECPFRTVESILTYVKTKTNLIFVDVHAEATSEKMGLGFYLDGKVTGVVGTHTHTQTADERILPQGTAYISDLGMTGALNSMLGMKKGPIIQHFLTQMPVKFEVEDQGPMVLYGAWIEADVQTGKAVRIDGSSVQDDQIHVINN